MGNNSKLVAKFVWCELIAPSFAPLAIILMLPFLFPIVLVGLGVMKLRDSWGEFKRTEAAAAIGRARRSEAAQPVVSSGPNPPEQDRENHTRKRGETAP